jgi:hypothetical protein
LYIAKIILAPSSVGVKFIETYYQGVPSENAPKVYQIKMSAI